LVIRVSREPAEKTSTSPLGRALGELEAAALAELEGAAEELEELEELEEELLQPAAASPMQEINASAAICTPRR
jgi:hypothetical protein